MYYVVGKNSSLSSSYAYFSNYPDNFDRASWITGEKFSPPPMEFTIVADAGTPAATSDLLLTRFDLLVASPRLISLFNSMKIVNLQYLPVRVCDEDGAVIATGYQAVQIIGKCTCLDKENSNLMYSADGESLLAVEEFSILGKNILPVDGTDKKPLIFRLEEFSYIALAHESLKQECEKQGITGIKFTKPEDYF